MRTSAAIAPLFGREHRVQVHLGDFREVGDELRHVLDHRRERVAIDRRRRRARPSASRRPRCRRASTARRPCVAGARRNVMSFSTSTRTPPRPNATSLPNAGSVTAPMITSWPPCEHLLHLHAERCFALALYFFALAMIVVVALARPRRRSSRRRARRRLRSCAGSPARRSSARPESPCPRRACAASAARRRHAFLRHRDAVRVADELAFRRGQRRAALGLDRVEDAADLPSCRVAIVVSRVEAA